MKSKAVAEERSQRFANQPPREKTSASKAFIFLLNRLEK
jgi:hypothetical protein